MLVDIFRVLHWVVHQEVAPGPGLRFRGALEAKGRSCFLFHVSNVLHKVIALASPILRLMPPRAPTISSEGG